MLLIDLALPPRAHRHAHPRAPDRAGMVLVVVLGLVALLSALVLQSQVRARLRLRLADARWTRDVLRRNAADAVRAALRDPEGPAPEGEVAGRR